MIIQITEAPHGSALYNELTALRHEILRAPLGLAFTPEELEKEKDDIHLAALIGGSVVGSLLLRHVDDHTVRIMRMAVAENAQGQGVGNMLIRHAENLIREKNYRKIMMHARSTAIPFYEKHDYKTLGEEFSEQTIPHIHMEKSL